MRDWRRPVKELPELMREAGYFREAARLEREFTLKRISRLLGGDYMMILLACELVKSVKRKWREEEAELYCVVSRSQFHVHNQKEGKM